MLAGQSISFRVKDLDILSNVSFELAAGEHLLVLGPSGSGKTTLLSVLTGLQKPTEGAVLYDGVSLYDKTGSEIDAFRGTHIGLVFQTLHLVKILTARQNLQLAQSLSGSAVDETHISETLVRLGLSDRQDEKVSRLSVGEAQRLAVARAVIGQPKWIFCDEPTSALDDRNTDKMLTLLEDEADRCGASLIVVSHDARVQSHFEKHQTLRLNSTKQTEGASE